MQIKQSQKKIPDTSKLVKKSDHNAKVSEIEGKITSIRNLATISALTAVNLVLVIQSKKQVIRQKLVNQKRKLLIMAMTNILQLQNLVR